jgi:hypothetical protein
MKVIGSPRVVAGGVQSGCFWCLRTAVGECTPVLCACTKKVVVEGGKPRVFQKR